jgi:hypothetical protein
LDIIRDFASLLEYPAVAIHVFVDFLDEDFDKFLCFWLPECLLKIGYSAAPKYEFVPRGKVYRKGSYTQPPKLKNRV